MPVPSGVDLEFTHLHVASSYSLRYGTATPRALATRAAELGMEALALTDRDGVYGAFKHVKACADAGIKPLLGADLALSFGARSLEARSLEARSLEGRSLEAQSFGARSLEAQSFGAQSFEAQSFEARAAGLDVRSGRSGRPDRPGRPCRVTLLATGRQGWASLCRLVSAAHAVPVGTGPASTGAEEPGVTPELIAEHAAGLVLLLGPASDVGQAVAARRPDLARRALDRWRYLGVEAVVEIVDHLEHKSAFRAARLAEVASDAGTPAVLTNAVRYLDPAGSLAAQVLDAARHLLPLGSPRLVSHNGRAYLASPADMAVTAERVAAAMTGSGGRSRAAATAARLLAATAELARRCVLDAARDLGVGDHHLPEFQGTTRDQHKELRERCEYAILHGRYRTASAANRGRGVSRLRAARNARDRLEHELDIIGATGMAPYFLTVADVADRIRGAGIRCAIRGSGAGSFVNHLLGISAIDPLEHDLLMERFLSPVRATLPDIDLDVESARRLEAYRIIFDAYGAERTACVCMMETYRARSAIRDVAAAMSLPPDEIGAIAKAFPHIRAKHITAALTELPELRRSRLNDAQLGTLFGIAEQLDGLPRHVAMHPCGVLLSDKSLLDRTAVQRSAEGFPLSQLDKDDAEIAGVIKLDVLGVRMQSAMACTLTEIERTTGEKIDIDAIARDDAPTYAMIQRSDTLGCFQIESPGQRELVKKMAPRDIADLIIDISLFRPGPVNSDMITPFLRARHGLAEPRYPHEKLVDALRETGGVVVFHEQVLRVLDAMTGCGLAEADLIRRHLSMEDGPGRTAPWFRARALARGFDPVTVERVWEVVSAFGGFGFCKAHAAAFAIPVYQSAWLKRHHPAAFYAGVLTHEPGMYPKRVIIADARLSGVQVLPVDVNSSGGDWKAETPSAPSPYDAPGSSHDAPGSPQDAPGSPHDAPGSPQDTPGAPQDTPGSPQDTPGGPAGDGPPGDGPVPGHPRSPGLTASAGMTITGVPRRVAEAASRVMAARRLPRATPDSAGAAAIRCSLRDVKGISGAEVDRIIAGQPYVSLRDFWDRARVSRPVAERLVLVGAFDSLYATAPAPSLPPNARSSPLPTRRDLLARVGMLARQSPVTRPGLPGSPPTLDLFATAEAADGMDGLVPAGELRDLDLPERVEAELDILGFDNSQHVLHFYADLLAELGVVRSADLDGHPNGEMVLVAGAKVATQTPAVRSGQRIIFASLDDAVGLVDLAFFESVQDRCAARLFGSWLLLVRGRVRRAGAGPMAVTVNGTECWDIPALEEIRVTKGMTAVHAAMAAGDVGLGAHNGDSALDQQNLSEPNLSQPNLSQPNLSQPNLSQQGPGQPELGGQDPGEQADPDDPAGAAATRPAVFANGFTLSPYAETGGPGGSIKRPPRTLWHASPGSAGNPDQ
jgi:error-prone DNA polymerase